MSMGSLGFNQGRSDEGWRPLTLPLILSPSIWALVNNHQWVGPGDRSLALRKINISALVKAASHLAQTRKFHPRLSMMSQYQSEEKPRWAVVGALMIRGENLYASPQKMWYNFESEEVGAGLKGGTGPLETRGWLMEAVKALMTLGLRLLVTANIFHWPNLTENMGKDCEPGWANDCKRVKLKI